MEDKFEKIAKKYSFKTKEVKTILNKSKGKRTFFMEDYTINPYMGCSFDCSYCYINGSKYADHTKKFYVKQNAQEKLRTQLKNKAKKGERGILMLGSATDPYMPIESELFLTRDILKLINRYKYCSHILTKSDLILRDLDILKKIKNEAILPNDLKGNERNEKKEENEGKKENEKNEKLKMIVSFSFSTTDDKIAKIFEENAPPPSKRLKAIKKLKKENFHVGASLMPILPYITDTEEAIHKTFEDLKKAGAIYALPAGLSLFGDENSGSKGSYFAKLREYYPENLEDTQNLFKNKNYASQSYYNRQLKNLERIAKEYNIKTSIF